MYDVVEQYGVDTRTRIVKVGENDSNESMKCLSGNASHLNSIDLSLDFLCFGCSFLLLYVDDSRESVYTTMIQYPSRHGYHP